MISRRQRLDTFTVGDPARPNEWRSGALIDGGDRDGAIVYNDQASIGSAYYHVYALAPFRVSRGPFGNFEQRDLERVTFNTSNSADWVHVMHAGAGVPTRRPTRCRAGPRTCWN